MAVVNRWNRVAYPWPSYEALSQKGTRVHPTHGLPFGSAWEVPPQTGTIRYVGFRDWSFAEDGVFRMACR
jgi:hypothetical protein